MPKELEQRVLLAQTDREEANRLISEYLPLIKKQVAGLHHDRADYDDMLSIAMLAFLNAIRAFDGKRGSFLSFAQLHIRSRLIDEFRKTTRAAGNVIPLFPDDEDEKLVRTADETASIKQYNREQERSALVEEIKLIQEELGRHGIQFSELGSISPKQDRSRKQCTLLAQAIVSDEQLRQDFQRTSRIPQNALAEKFQISVKTIEKHRKYILTVTVMLLGDYPGIRAFLPEEVRQFEGRSV